RAGIAAARIASAVLARVPAAGAQVDPAAEGDPVVDHDQLLVVRAAERVLAVEPELDAPVRAEPEAHGGQERALERVEQREVPLEQVRAQAAPAPHELVEELGERAFVAAALAAAQAHAAVQVPAEDQDRALGAL